MSGNAIAVGAIVLVIVMATAVLLALPPVKVGCPLEPTGRFIPTVIGKTVIPMPEYRCSDRPEGR